MAATTYPKHPSKTEGQTISYLRADNYHRDEDDYYIADRWLQVGIRHRHEARMLMSIHLLA